MRLSVIAVAAALGGLIASSADAMPIAAVGTVAKAPVVNVDYACGRGWHLTPRGVCRPNRYGPPRGYGWGYYRPPPPRWGWYGHRPYYRDGWDGGWRGRPRDW
ncbi:GCG_CRPN prefix-to-repeats domain-containing protein [Rhizobium sp. BR 362]|uniref:GCG_CRPN prefix-to-repeats domain-containing protein n=1 Tax=Rhizobium sp. BR 362 TaxID=3040670 RepID=UPI002F404338